jgi:DNA modification methylase
MEVYRVLKPEGTLWLNIGDSYNGSGGNHKDTHKNDTGFQGNIGVKYGGKGAKVEGLKPKDLIGIPWMLAFSLRNAGWYLRQDIIWHKPNPMPESVTDRCTKSHEYIFLLSKSQKYYFDYEAISEPCADQNRTNYQSGSRSNGENKDRNDNDLGERSKLWKPRTKNCQYDGQQPNTMHLRREQGLPDKEYTVRNKRDVWSVNVKPDSVAHFATYPEELITPCILAGSPNGGVVLDPFMGSGTTARVARKLNRHFVGFELNPEYCKIIEKKIQVEGDLFY